MSETYIKVYTSPHGDFMLTVTSGKEGGIYNSVVDGQIMSDVPISESSVKECFKQYDMKDLSRIQRTEY